MVTAVAAVADAILTRRQCSSAWWTMPATRLDLQMTRTGRRWNRWFKKSWQLNLTPAAVRDAGDLAVVIAVAKVARLLKAVRVVRAVDDLASPARRPMPCERRLTTTR